MSSNAKSLLFRKKSNKFKPKSFLSNSAIISYETPAFCNAASAVAKFTFLSLMCILVKYLSHALSVPY